MSYGTVQAEKMTTESGYSLGAGNASSFKNRIINGAMTIDQRNAGASVAIPNAVTTYTVDRWNILETGSMAFSAQRSTTAPSGFTNSLLITTTTSAVPGADERCQLVQRIEGSNVADLGWGTANAKAVTLSFWIRSSLTGQFGGSLQNGNQNRSYPFAFTISAANTFEYKTITSPGDTTGTWNTNTDTGIQVNFDLGMGSNILGTAGSWSGSDFRGATGDVRLSGTNGATLFITGVQLEVGTVATSYDFRSIITELSLCQRYYYQSSGGSIAMVGQTYSQNSVDGLYMPYPFPSVMRVAPTSTILGGTNGGSPANIQMYESYPTNVVINLRSTGGTTSVFWVGATLRSSAEL
jgi:hypothetical protein